MPATRSPFRLLCAATLALVASALVSACVLPADDAKEEALVIGALLPFTGDQAVSGANLERAVLWAAESMNAAGGIAGLPIRVVSRDTHSDVAQGLAAADGLLELAPTALIGPDGDDLVLAVAPRMRDAGLVEVSGGFTGKLTDGGGVFFSTMPSAVALGAGLADRIVADGMSRVVIIHMDDAFGRRFAQVVVAELAARGSPVAGRVGLAAGERRGFAVVRESTAGMDPDAYVLATYAGAGAQIIQDWAAAGRRTERWYFAHTLKSEVFLRNVPRDSIEGMVGVSPALGQGADLFRSDFAERWYGEAPLDGAFFYFDAMALVGLAVEAAARDAGGVPSGAAIASALIDISANPRGKSVMWMDLGEALADVRAGTAINYRGASGSVNFDAAGELEEGVVQFWSVQGGAIVNGDTTIAHPLSE